MASQLLQALKKLGHFHLFFLKKFTNCFWCAESTPAFLRKARVAVQISFPAPFFRSSNWNNTDMGGRIRNHPRSSLSFCPVFLKAVTSFWCKIETISLGEFLPDANTNLSEADGAFCFKTGIAQLWDFC